MKKEWNKNTEIKDYHQELTNKLIEAMEDSQKTGWSKPWFVCNQLPFNPVTGTKYKGVNVVSLMTNQFDDPRFMSYKNVGELAEKTGVAMNVKKGAKGTPVFKAIQFVINEKGESKTIDPEAQSSSKSFFKLAYAGTVFNASQIDGIDFYIKRVNTVESNDEVENLATALRIRTGLKIEHSEIGMAYYSPAMHKVHMPLKERFKDTTNYLDTLLHEFGHASGRDLKRELHNEKGSAGYAFEELVAELSSVFVSAELGIVHNATSHDNHVAYMEGWLKSLKDDKNFIFKAASKASKSCEYQLTHKAEYEKEIELSKAMSLEQKQEFITEKIMTVVKSKAPALTM